MASTTPSRDREAGICRASWGRSARAAAVGSLRGLSALQMRNALGLAGSQSAGTWASWGTPTVKFHQSRGAVSGLLAGLLAEQNFTASAEILVHPDGGIFAAYSNGGDPSAAIAGLGQRFAMENISLRLWPGGTPLQPTLTAAFELLAAHRPAFDQIERVRIEVAPDVYEAHARFAAPEGTFDALLSYPFTMASALRDGRFWLDSIGPARSAIRISGGSCASGSSWWPIPAWPGSAAGSSSDGRGARALEATAAAAKGTPANPASPAELRAKFEHAVAGRISDAHAAELLELLLRIDEAEDLDRLFELLRIGARARRAMSVRSVVFESVEPKRISGDVRHRTLIRGRSVSGAHRGDGREAGRIGGRGDFPSHRRLAALRLNSRAGSGNKPRFRNINSNRRHKLVQFALDTGLSPVNNRYVVFGGGFP